MSRVSTLFRGVLGVLGARLAFDTAFVSLLLCCAAGCLNDPEDLHRPRRRSPDVTRTPDAGMADGSADASNADDGDALPRDAGAAGAEPALDAAPPAASAWNPQPRWILEGEVENARDLAGVPLEPGADVRLGRLFRGPPLAPLTAAGCEAFRELGIRTVIDLRIAEERVLKPEASCVQDSATLVAAPLPVPYSVSPSDYVADLDAAGSMATLFERLGDPDAYPIYFHCTWGRDRTGVVAAVLLSALGASRADILKEYLLSQPKVGAYPNSLETVLDVIEQRGGIDAHLARAGVSKQQIATLREQAGAVSDEASSH